MNQDTLTTFDFEEASRENILLKLSLCGPPGSGKSMSALKIATYLSKALNLGDVYVIDSENRSSLKYAYNQRTGKGFRFKALHLPKDNSSPEVYMKALDRAKQLGARMVVIDSISHAWNGVNGILELVDQWTSKSNSKNAFSEGWRKATPMQRRFVQAILHYPGHTIVTMRADPDWVVQENDRGKKEPTLVGLAPQQRKDISYEFDISLMIDRTHRATVEKTRCEELNDNGGIFDLPGENVGRVLEEWIRMSDAMTPEQEKRLELALAAAVAAGLEAARAKNTEEYQAARETLRVWCEGHGILAIRRDQALQEMKARVASSTQAHRGTNGAASPASSPTLSDDAHARAIDAGEA